MRNLTPVERLTAQLIAAGYPVQCISDNGNGTYSATLNSTATPAQRAAVNALVAAYVDSPRVGLPLATIISNIQALTTAQQNKLLILVVALAVQDNPQLGNLVGVTVAGDAPG